MLRKLCDSVALLLSLLVCSLGAAPLYGQSPELESERLALALLEGSAGGELLVGQAPADFPVELLPEGATILGSAVQRNENTIAVLVPLRSSEAEAILRQTFLDAGWEYAAVGRSGGFVRTEEQNLPRDARPPIFCRDGQMVRLATSRDADGSIARFSWSRRSPGPWCDRNALGSSRIPMLPPPASANMVGGGGSSGSDHMASTSAYVESTLSPGELVEHYASELEAAGWTSAGAVAGESHASRELAMLDEAGAEWVGLVSATKMPGLGWTELRLVILQPQEVLRSQWPAVRR
jgi:hypothetical protein